MSDEISWHERVITEQSAAGTTGSVGPARCSRVREFTAYVTFSAGCTGGEVVIEGGPFEDYGGTWAQLASVPFAAEDRTHEIAVTGVSLARRARITSAITGSNATVTVDFVGR